jgi:hypothetical protein
MSLDQQLKALNEAERRTSPPPHLEQRLMEAFDARRREPGPRRERPVRQRFVVGAALAAGVTLGVGGSIAYFHGGAAPVVPAQPVGESVVFVLDPSGVQEAVRVVRIRVARSALESLGISTVAAQDSESVEVDILVGDDGVARGVRLANVRRSL